MGTETYTLKIPDPLARKLEAASEEFLIDLLERGLLALRRIERALEKYARGGVSFAAAGKEASVPRSELALHAYAQGMEPPFNSQTLTGENH